MSLSLFVTLPLCLIVSVFITPCLSGSRNRGTVLITDGRIVERGKYAELVQQRGPFWQFLEEYKTKGSDDQDTDSEKSSQKILMEEEVIEP